MKSIQRVKLGERQWAAKDFHSTLQRLQGEVQRLHERDDLSDDEFAARVDELLPRVEEGVRAAEILSVIHYKDDRNAVLAPVAWDNGPLNWEQKELLLGEVMLRVPIWRSRVPHTLEHRLFRYNLERERDENPNVSFHPFE